MPNQRKIYSWLLGLYPARFREEYQSPMERQFQDEYRDAAGFGERLALWQRAIADLAFSAPREILREMGQDLKHTLRVYRRRPLAPLLAVCALTLAIGASTGIFSVLNALLVRGLPFSHAEQLVELRNSPFGALQGRRGFNQWMRRSAYLQDAATFSLSEMNLAGDQYALRVKVAETSANFFKLLGTESVVGRTFSPDEDPPAQTKVAVISHRLWQQSYGGTSRVASESLRLDGVPFTIIGVAPPRFDYPGRTDVWTPSVFSFETVPKRGALLFQTVARLKPGATVRSARAVFASEVQRSAPGLLKGAEQDRAHIVSLQNELAGPVGQAGWVLAGMILFVLLTACANVAQLLLSRSTGRQQEFAIRAALGASRARLVQQLVTEAVALTVCAGALGLLVAQWTARLASSIAPASLSMQEYTILDWRVLAFAAALALLMGIVFGILPALVAGRLQPSGEMMRTQAGPGDRGNRKTQAVLVGLQAGLTLILVAGSITMGRTFLQLLNTDMGFRTPHVVTLKVSLLGTKHQGPQAEWRYYSAALDRLRAAPGVEAAGAVSYLPLADNAYMAFGFKLDSGQAIGHVVVNATMPGYFKAVGTNLLAGHDFRPAEPVQSSPEIIVNEAFAQSAGLGTAIVGRNVKAPWSATPYRITGVVATASLAGPGHPGGPQIYFRIQEEPPAALTFVARVPGDADAYLARCRDQVRALDPQVPVFDVMTLDQRLALVLARPKFYTTATLFLASLALLLAVIGMYGMASYSVAQRTHEIGVRMALGATYGRVRAMMLRENLQPALVGLLPGVAGAFAAGRLLGHLLDRAQPLDPFTCAAAAGVLLITGVLASWVASARVLAIAPADAVRVD